MTHHFFVLGKPRFIKLERYSIRFICILIVYLLHQIASEALGGHGHNVNKVTKTTLFCHGQFANLYT